MRPSSPNNDFVCKRGSHKDGGVTFTLSLSDTGDIKTIHLDVSSDEYGFGHLSKDTVSRLIAWLKNAEKNFL